MAEIKIEYFFLCDSQTLSLIYGSQNIFKWKLHN